MHQTKSKFKKPLYPFKHWCAVLLIAPLISFLFAITPSDTVTIDTISIYFIVVACGVFFSFPTFLIYYFLYIALARQKFPPIFMKIILNAEAILGMFLSLKLIDGYSIAEFFAPYAITIIGSSLFFRIDKPSPENITETNITDEHIIKE